MAGRAVPVHYLRPNERDFTPGSLIFLRTGHQTVITGVREVLALRHWCARFVDRRTIKGSPRRDEAGAGQSGVELAAWITQATRNRSSTWLFTHDLAFDLMATRLPMVLGAAGWAVTDAAIMGRNPWLRFRRNSRVLTVVDSGSWLAVPLDELARHLQLPYPKAPAAGADLAALHARGRAELDVLTIGMRQLLDWWDAEKLGNWSLSGAGCGWNSYRHRRTPDRVTIDPDPARVKRDRDFTHGGRRGTWRIGSFGHGPYWELDFVAAYPTIAAHCPHPIARSWTFDSLPLDDPNLFSSRWGVTASVLIDTDTARWPVRLDRTSWYPVGRFWADLAGPDITEALRLGVVRAIGRGEVHRLAPQMADWGQWVLSVQHGTGPPRPPAARLAAKHWGRTVIGKWSQHAHVREALGPAPNTGWGYEEAWDREHDCSAALVDLGGQRWYVHSGGDPENAYPAVTAWVESEVRVRLSRVIAAVGERAVIQCDTDGLIVDGRLLGTPHAGGHLIAPAGAGDQSRLNWVLDNIDPVTAPLVLRVKARTDHVSVIGPQHVATDNQRRLAGMPRTAVEQADGTFTARQWPGLKWQLTHGDPRGYVRPEQTFTIRGVHPTGWLLEDRTVVPVETTVTASGSTIIVPFRASRYGRAGLRLDPRQHRTLDAML